MHSSSRDLLITGPVAWDGVDQRPHHFVRRLARSRRVLWLNPGLTLEIPRFVAEPLKALKAGRAYLHTDHGRARLLYSPPELPNLRVLSVVGPLPFGGRSRLVHAANSVMVAAQVKAALAAFPLRDPIFVAEHPKAHALAKRLGIRTIVYDSIDDFGAFEGWHKAAVLDAYDRELLAAADLVTASSDGLVKRALGVRAQAELLPNGVELRFFPTDAEPVELPPGTGRVFGFVGALYDWIDLELIEALARRRPSDRVVLVGPLKASLTGAVERLQRQANVRFVGPVPHTDVARWIAAFDACLLPFRRSRLTESVNPLKLYEYFALGKPCLATAIPEVARYGELVALADSASELPAALEAIEREWSEPATREARARARRVVAEEHSWDGITARLEALLGELA